jgi:hypothetical protein
MKRFFFTLVFFGFFANIPAFAEDISASPSPEPVHPVLEQSFSPSPSPDNLLNEAIKKQQDAIKAITEKSEGEKLVENINTDLLNTELEKQTVQALQEKVSNEIQSLQQEIEQKDQEIADLQQKLKESQDFSEEEKKTMEVQQESFEEEKKRLQASMQQKENTLQTIQAELDRLVGIEQIKELALQKAVEFKKDLDEHTQKVQNEKMNILYLVLGLFLLAYIGKFFLPKKYKIQYRTHLTYFDILSALGLFFFLVWFIFYIKPDLLVILIFLGGTIVIIMQEFIISLISSFFIVNQYMLGDRIRYQDGEGIIVQLTPLKVVLDVIDAQGFRIGEKRKIPNSFFLKQEVTKIETSIEEKIFFQVIFRDSLTIDIAECIEWIEKEILQPSIINKIHNEITGEITPYSIKFSYTGEGRPSLQFSWRESPEKNRRIQKKIMSYVQMVTTEKISPNE